jgi:hypothetical protein
MLEDKNYLYMGVDVHKHSSTITILNKNGIRLTTEKMPNNHKGFEELLSGF